MSETWKPWRDGTYEVSDLGNIRRAKPGAHKMPHSKLTAELVANARLRVASGEKQCVVARELGVSVSQMSRVIRGTRWTHM